jgi:hypothetical protein
MNANDQAFPLNEERWYDEVLIGATYHEGLTKREYFAALAVQGYLSSGTAGKPLDVAQAAIEYADALIAGLKKPVSKIDKNGIDADYEAAWSDLNDEEEALCQELAGDDLLT